MTRRLHSLGLAAGLFACSTLPTHAGMSVFVLSDVAEARLEVISFLIAGYLLLAWAVKRLWNALRATFTSLPLMSYRNALALMLVSGLLMYVVLTMISGAREILAPGAWMKEGIEYNLRDTPEDSPKSDRERVLSTLKVKLWDFAASHDGRFPRGIFDPEFPRANWVHPTAGGYYCYLPPPETPGRHVLVYEPANAGPKRYVLLSDGAIELWKERKLNSYLRK